MPAFAYAHCVPFGAEGRETTEGKPGGVVGVLLRAAAQEPAAADLLAQIEGTLGISGPQVLRYADARRGQRRAMRLHAATDVNSASLDAFLLAGDAAAAGWVLDLLQDGQPARPFGHALLNGRASPPAANYVRIFCICRTCLSSRFTS